MLLAVAACQPREKVPEATVDVVKVTATQAETRSVVGESQMGEAGIPILWESNDKIWVRSARQEDGTPGVTFRTKAAAISNGGRTAEFQGVALNAGPYVAVYPRELVVSNNNNETVTLNVPKEQTYRENSFAKGANISAAMWEGTEATFWSVAGSLRLRLNGYNTIRKITVIDNDPSFALWGECTLLYSASGITASWANEAEDRNRLVLTCGEDITLNQSSTVDFYFAVPEGAFAKGYTCELYNANDELVGTIEDSGNHAVGCNQILTVETGQPTFEGEGTDAQPYQIACAADLARLADLCNGEYAELFKDKSYIQTADIDMTGVPHQSVGAVKANAFTGKYNGGGYTVSNLAPTPAVEAAAGLFGYVDGAEITNLKVDGYTNFGTVGEQGTIAGNAVNTKFSDITDRKSVV